MSAEVKPGYEQTEIGVIPKDWAVSTLRELTLDMLQGINTAIDKPEYVQDGVPLLKANNIIDKIVNFDTSDHISINSYSRYSDRYKLKKYDFLFSNIGARLGTGSLLKEDIRCSFAWNIMRIAPNQKKIDPEFLSQSINSSKISGEIKARQSGSGMGFVPKGVMQNILIAHPVGIDEQKSISIALSDMDSLISSLDQLIAKKRDIQLAAMQQLLTGERRLPGFADPWIKRNLGQIASLYQPETISQSDFVTDGYPVFGANGLIGFYDRFNHEKPQITISCRGNCGTVNKTPPKTWITGNAMVVNIEGRQDVNFDFLYQTLKSKDFSSIVSGSGQPQIVRGPLAAFELGLPSSLAEQAAIASTLTDMDIELTTLEIRSDKARKIKQGMMEELLIGRIRLA